MLVYDKEEPVTDNLITWVFDENSFVPAAKLVGDKSYSILTDHLGTPYEAYDESGEKVWSAEYDLYGNIHTLEGEKEFIPFRYQGQYEDVEFGLYYNRFRYYSPESGTYISQDPIRLAGNNPNFYGYTFDSNIEVDVWGLYDTVYFSNPIKQVIIKMQGDRELDYKEANKAAEINGKRGKPTIKAHKDNYGDVVWHHAAYDEETNSCIMQLVYTSEHKAKLPHEGAVKQFEIETGVEYDTKAAKDKAKELNKKYH